MPVTLLPRMCPCGHPSCTKVILNPLCNCQCSSVTPEEAREVTVKVNHFDRVVAALADLLANPGLTRPQLEARTVLELAEQALRDKPEFPEFEFSAKAQRARTLKDLNVNLLNIPKPLCNLLVANGMEWVRDIVTKTPAQLKAIRGLGPTFLSRLQAALASYNLNLAE
jgi:hypothetical protein